MNTLGRVLLQECTGNSFTIRMHWKGFYNEKAFESVLL